MPSAILDRAARGAFNMHGSLLPRYRGRAPTNWAVLHDEQETGATLHEMVERADRALYNAKHSGGGGVADQRSSESSTR